MAFWDIDLETRMGAESAADQGGLACFVYAGLTALSTAFIFSTLGIETLEGQIAIGLNVVQMVITLVAGFRLRSGHGAYWAIAAAALLVMSLIIQLAELNFGLGVLIGIILLVFTVQGARGAWALKRGGFAEDDVEAFE